MKVARISRLALAAALVTSAGAAMAADSVTINGVTHTCTNSCVVTINSNGTYSVRDSDGGRVRISFPSTEEK